MEAGSAYACIEGGSIEEVSDSWPIGIISDERPDGGLPVLDKASIVLVRDGDSE